MLFDPSGQKLWEWFPTGATLSSVGAEWLDAGHFLVTYTLQQQNRGGLILLEMIDQIRAPRIVTASQNPSLLPTRDLTLSPDLVNENDAAFQWLARQSGVVANLEGATNRSLQLSSVSAIASGYFLTVSNSFGSAMSPEFLVPPALQITNLSLTTTGSVRLTLTGSTGVRIDVQQSRSLTNWKSVDLPMH